MSAPRRAANSQRRTDPTRAARFQRDAGIERARSITKGVAFGSVAAVAVAGVYLSQALPGHTASPGSSTGGATAPAAAPTGSSDGSGSATQYPTQYPTGNAPAAPASAPTPAYNQAPVVSSGSS